jgi:hypothetical protein
MKKDAEKGNPGKALSGQYPNLAEHKTEIPAAIL